MTGVLRMTHRRFGSQVTPRRLSLVAPRTHRRQPAAEVDSAERKPKVTTRPARPLQRPTEHRQQRPYEATAERPASEQASAP